MSAIIPTKQQLLDEIWHGHWPDHTELPAEDGRVHNFQEHPQATLLSDSILPVLQQRHPDGRFTIGQDCGIYWRRDLDNPLRGCISPDWYYVPNVEPLIDGQIRRSYVMWQELIAPFLILEFASGDGSEERDTTPESGKFWVYEKVIRPSYYGVFVFDSGEFELHRYDGVEFVPINPDASGNYRIDELNLALGLWQGAALGMNGTWMRWYDAAGNLLPLGQERADQEHARAEKLAARLRELGVDPDSV